MYMKIKGRLERNGGVYRLLKAWGKGGSRIEGSRR